MTCIFALSFDVDIVIMAPFEPPESVITGFKERIEALSIQGIGIQSITHTADLCKEGDRLYVGTAIGNLSVYSVDIPTGRFQHWAIKPCV
jgi:hypothetical protein